MKITLVGPGALGCLFAACLTRVGAEIWMLDHKETRASRLSSQGLCLVEGGQKTKFPVRVTTSATSIGTSEVVLFCVKSQDIAEAIRRVQPLLEQETLIVALQNGIGHHHELNKSFKAWTAAVTAQGASLREDGEVVHGGKGVTSVGLVGTVNTAMAETLNALVALFNQAGMETLLSDDIAVPIWNKLLVNVGINALTALNDCPNGKLLEIPQALLALESAVKEGEAVARAKGIKIVDDPVTMTKKVCQATCHNISSMLADVRQGRLTEIDAINGALVKEAKSLGLSAPVNMELVSAVKALPRKTIE